MFRVVGVCRGGVEQVGVGGLVILREVCVVDVCNVRLLPYVYTEATNHAITKNMHPYIQPYRH